ncbi:MAG: HTH domain-containing protein [Ruminococcaceae bacterium]|nr:HTH domain-containing protein [Oscillospiraceae bacterium]
MKFRKFSVGCPSYKSGNLNVSELARVCELSRTTVYKYISLLNK